jgi:hypothetical protein
VVLVGWVVRFFVSSVADATENGADEAEQLAEQTLEQHGVSPSIRWVTKRVIRGPELWILVAPLRPFGRISDLPV